MNEFVKKIKDVKLDKKNKIILLIGALALVFLLLNEIGGETEEVSVTRDSASYSAEYTKKIERQLEDILSEINGAGRVQVMVTLDTCYENVYAKGYSAKTEENDVETQNETEEEYIIIKKGSNNEECLVVKVYEPQIKGVAVVAEGADNIQVKKAITETVCALFDISSAKVSVEKSKL